MKDYYFNSIEEVIVNLKQIGVINKTATPDDLDELPYRVLGFSYKFNPAECLNPVYMNLIAVEDGKQFNINIDYFRSL